MSQFIKIIETPVLREKYGTDYQVQYSHDADGNQGAAITEPYGPGEGPMGDINPLNAGAEPGECHLGDSRFWYPVYRYADDDPDKLFIGIAYYLRSQLQAEGLLPAAPAPAEVV